MEDKETDILLKLNDHDNKIKSLGHRMDAQEQQSKAINDLAMSVKELALNMGVMNEKQTAQDKRLSELESKPSKRWETIVQVTLTAVVGAVIGFMLSRLGLK